MVNNVPPPVPLIKWPRPWYRKLRWQITIVTIVGILTAALLWWCPWCTVRVTDGSDLLADNLREVQDLILDENERVTDSGRPWVSIAIMLPFRTTDDERNKPEDALRHLQGAYLAQYWSNHPNGDDRFGSSAPLIRILIADTGQGGQEWQDTVAQLGEMADPENSERLVAVTGIGLSTDATQQAVDVLADKGISMVGSVITATGLAAPGLFRVAPTNSDEAAAMIDYLKDTPEWRSASATAPYKAYLVQDRAGDDTYAQDLGNQYRRTFPNDDDAHTLLQAQGDYDGESEGAGNAIAATVNTICSVRPKVVFFAGRSDGLRTFLGALSARYCSGTPITVVTADGANNLNARTDAPLWVDGANLEVFYTALASPQTWQSYPTAVSRDTVSRFGQCANCFSALFSESLDNGDAIMSHDAVLTAVTAARSVASQQSPQPTADALINGLYQINATNPAPGASGWIYFQREAGIPDGVPYNKAMPIMRLHSNGTATQEALSSRSGTPPAGPEPPR